MFTLQTWVHQIEYCGFCPFAHLRKLFSFIYKVNGVLIRNERFSMSFGNFRTLYHGGYQVFFIHRNT